MPRTGLTPDALKEKALDAAEHLICEFGADRLKLTDVARSLGVSHAALYKHFSEREDLLDGVSRRWLDRIDGELARIASEPAPVEERLSRWFLALHRLKRERVKNNPKLYTAFDRSAQKMRPFIRSHLCAALEQLKSILGDGVRDGELRPEDPDRLAGVFFEATAAFHHPRLVWESIDEDREWDLKKLIGLLVSGLRPRA